MKVTKLFLAVALAISLVSSSFAVNTGTLPTGATVYRGTDYMQIDFKNVSLNPGVTNITVSEAASYDMYFYFTSSAGSIPTSNVAFKTFVGDVTVTSSVVTGHSGRPAPQPSAYFTIPLMNYEASSVRVSGNIILIKR